MPTPTVERPVSALRQRMLEDVAIRGLRRDTQHDYVRCVRNFAAWPWGSAPWLWRRQRIWAATSKAARVSYAVAVHPGWTVSRAEFTLAATRPTQQEIR